MQDGIISIQSHVAFGHVGNSAAAFPLQRLGHEVWPVNTVLFSNHTGYGAWRGDVLPVATVREVLAGVEERGGFDRAKAVLSGYLGTPELGCAVLETVAHGSRPPARTSLYVCDPVMGDLDRGFFVREGLPEFFKDEAVPGPTSSRRTSSSSPIWLTGSCGAWPTCWPRRAGCARWAPSSSW